MTRLLVGPFNRVEGDLEVRLDIADGAVRRAEVVSPLFRGFEPMLAGRPVDDALIYAPRICGICSVSQSVASARAIAAARGLAPTRDGQLAINLVHAAENVADHLTHFYLFFMPDFARPGHAGEPWHGEASARFAAGSGSATADLLPARAAFLHVMGVLAGKWPHTLALRPGGVTRAVTGAMKAQLSATLFAFRRFLERHLFADRLESFAALASVAELDAWRRDRGGDAARFLAYAESLGLAAIGRSGAVLMSYGAYPVEGGHLFPAGRSDGVALDPSTITEDVAATWYEREPPRQPFDGATRPGDGLSDGYSWCKAPRLGGAIAEVGALARQIVAGNRLVTDFVARAGAGVTARILARLSEIALVTLAMERWIIAIDPRAPFASDSGAEADGQGLGLTEAARGALGHWLVADRGRIANYQIIAPTTWNFSPRDALGEAGPLERALVGVTVAEGETVPVAVQHVVRSFDPCMVCTVH